MALQGLWLQVGGNNQAKPKLAAHSVLKPQVPRLGPRTPTFAECNHPLLAEWDHKHNAAQGHFPDQVRLRSSKKIFWQCAKCPAGREHSWSAKPSTRTGGIKSGCPFCARMAACACNSLHALLPETAAEWDYSQNQGLPCDYTAGSPYLAWWSNPQRASWQQTIESRTSGPRKKPGGSSRSNQQQNSLT